MNENQTDHSEIDELLRAGHERFREQNPEQRQAILDCLSLPELRCSNGKWRAPGRLGWWISLTACAVVLLTGFSTWMFSTSATAYGIEGLPQRLAEVNSITLRGSQWWCDESTGHRVIRMPYEVLFKRPGKLRSIHTVCTYPDDRLEVSQSLHLCNGKQEWTVGDGSKPPVSRLLHPLDARLTTARMVQSHLAFFSLGPSETPYQKKGEETIHGRHCIVYEARRENADMKTVEISKAWIDPTDGIPVRWKGEVLDANGISIQGTELTEISVNTPLADSLFEYHPPDGQPAGAENKKIEAKAPATLDATPRGMGSGFGSFLSIWYGFRISDQAVLLVWRRSAPTAKQPDGNPDWLAGITMWIPDPAGKRPVRQAWLHESNSAERWNWMLVVPADGKPLGDRGEIHIKMIAPKSRTEMPVSALRFRDEELRPLLTEARRATLTDDAREMSLDDLRAQARELFESKSDARGDASGEK